MASVIERFGTEIVNDMIVHDDRPTTWERAETIAGRRLDRRKNYCIINGQVCSAIKWISNCSGCTESYELAGPQERGGGCSECGYTGRRWNACWMPDDGSEPKDSERV